MDTIGYRHCECRDCFELFVGSSDPTAEPTAQYCYECLEAGCHESDDGECQSESAYGGAA